MSHPDQAVAIVGIGCLFPKSPDLSAYWANIVAAVDCLSDVPADHSWKPADFYDADPNAKDKTWATRGGFLDKVPFDPVAFGIPPTHLESIDTTQLLSLIVAREALRDAGLDPDAQTWDRERVSCILGITGTQQLAVDLGSRLNGHLWRKALARCGVDARVADAVVQDIGNHMPTWTEQSFPGLLGNVVAGRIANRLDLGGTNCVVDAACASSLAAIQYAIGDLMAGRSDLALTGGADTLNDAFMFQCFTRTPAFSKHGDAKPFDADADGILIGEGIAILALKRLADAERDGDRIYAVIKAVGSSSDGRYKSIYAPNPTGQAKALRRTYETAGVSPATVELVEAHGTGTKAGDAAEIEGLKTVFGEVGRPGRWVNIGSVKSQIGHTKSTAGAAGLVKAALALHQRVLPPTAKIDAPNPKMGWEQSAFYLSPRARPWIRAADHPRRAAVSAFGFGGSNFHAVLEEHGDPAAAVPMTAAPAELFLFGGASAEELRAKLDQARRSAAPTLTHRAREVLERWAPATSVVAFVASSEDEFGRRLTAAHAALDGQASRDVFLGHGLTAPKVGFLFPGQGSQYVEMGRTLGLRHPAFRAALDAADEAFRQAGRGPLSARIFPPPAFDDATAKSQDAALTATEWAQPAIGAVSKGMADVLRGFGVAPVAVAGHSYGELVALRVAGVLDDAGFLAASRVRGELMASDGRDRGTMAAVNGPIARVAEVVAGCPGVVLANLNHPEQAVISGARDAIRAALATLADAGLQAKELPVSAAFHSPLVADASEPFARALAEVPFAAPAVPVYADATAAPYPPDADAARAMLVSQITSPVDFVGVVRAMAHDGVQVLVEVGPKGVLAGLAAKIAPELAVLAVDRNGHKGDDGDVQLKLALARLAALGVPVDVSPLLRERLPAAPRLAKSPATVWLAGANHRNPETLDPPMPELPKGTPAVPTFTSAAPAAGAPSWLDIPSTGAAMSRPPHLERSSEPVPVPVPVPVAAPAPAYAPAHAAHPSELAALLASTRDTLSAFQRAQEKTAEVHGQFLDAWSKASESFTTLFQTHARLVELAATGTVSLAPVTVAPARPPAPPPVPAYAPAPAPALSYVPAPAPVAQAPVPMLFAPAAPSPADDFGRVNPISVAITASSDQLPPIFDALAAVEGRTPGKSAPAAAPARSAGPSLDVLRAAVLASVAEKTGYPVDMLEPAMDLEADLGVDSIKRVEIMSTVTDRVPGLPELDNDRMSALRSLQDVIDYLGSVAGASAAATSAPTSSGPDQGALIEALLGSVAEKTGYPKDMLELAMDLEADLGVDSIKRVEILSSVSDRVPGLPELDNERMSGLRTLADVVGYLREVSGASEPQVVSAAAATGVPRGELPTPPKQPVSRDRLLDAVFACVAEKTGYPRDMLDPAMDLESDLGVDSIKRVEILSAVSDRVPELPELDNDALSSLRTLQDVVDHLSGVVAGLGFAHIGAKPTAAQPLLLVPPEAPPVEPPISVGLPPLTTARELLAPPPVALQRRVVTFESASPAGPAPALVGPVCVTVDRLGLAPKLITALRARGVFAIPLDPDWTSGVEVPGDCVGAVHLAALGATGDDLRARVRGAFLVAKGLAGRSLFATVSQLGGRFGQDGQGAEPLQGALAGLVKTVAHEWSGVHALALDVGDEPDAAALADALLSRWDTLELGLAPEPVALRTVPANLPSALVSAPIARGDVVVVSGGARGVTAAVVREMAKRWGPHLVLLGRSALAEAPAWSAGAADSELKARFVADARANGRKPTPKDVDAAVNAVLADREVRATLAAITAARATVEYLPVDIRDASAVADALRGRAVVGVVHAAGVIADKRVEDKAPEAFDRVFSTKVDGLANLLGAVDRGALKLVAAFSSTAGRYGNVGQCDYSMGNEALTHALLGMPHVRAVSFDWGPWDGGMVDGGLRRAFAERGIGVIPLELGARAFCDELERGDVVEVVYEGPRPERGRTVRTVSLETHPWLADHAIKGNAVVPVTVALGWMAELATEIHPGQDVVAVRELAVMKGIVVDGALDLRFSWEPAAAADGASAVSIEIAGREGPLGPTLHYRAIVELGERPQVPRFPGSNGLGADRFPWPVREAYDRWLFHGPHFQVIDEIVGISDHGMVAWVRPTSDDVLLDAAMQMMVLWVRAKQGSAALPTFVREYRPFRPFPATGRIACHLEVDRAGPTRGKFKATLVDDAGAILATISEAEYTADASLTPAFHGPSASIGSA